MATMSAVDPKRTFQIAEAAVPHDLIRQKDIAIELGISEARVSQLVK